MYLPRFEVEEMMQIFFVANQSLDFNNILLICSLYMYEWISVSYRYLIPIYRITYRI